MYTNIDLFIHGEKPKLKCYADEVVLILTESQKAANENNS